MSRHFVLVGVLTKQFPYTVCGAPVAKLLTHCTVKVKLHRSFSLPVFGILEFLFVKQLKKENCCIYLRIRHWYVTDDSWWAFPGAHQLWGRSIGRCRSAGERNRIRFRSFPARFSSLLCGQINRQLELMSRICWWYREEKAAWLKLECSTWSIASLALVSVHATRLSISSLVSICK
jgi:hypothetical protein